TGPRDSTPGVAWSRPGRAGTSRQKTDWHGAIREGPDPVPANPGFLWAYLARARAYAGKEDRAKAIANYTEAIELAPNFAPLYAERGAQRKEAGDDAAGDQDLAHPPQLDPTTT